MTTLPSKFQIEALRGRLARMVEGAKERCADPRYAEAVAKLEAEEAAFMSRRQVSRSDLGIPKGMWPLLDSPEETEAITVVKAFMDSSKLFCVLAGDVGRGKSIGLGYAIDTHGGRYVQALSLVQAGIYNADYWDDLALTPVLAIDELGMEPMDSKGYYSSSLYSLLDRRYSSRRKTLLATNLDATQFKARYGTGELVRLWDRLKTSGEWKPLVGPSLRKKEPDAGTTP